MNGYDSLKRSLLLIGDAEGELKEVRHEARLWDPVLRADAAESGEGLDGRVVASGKVMVMADTRRSGRADCVFHEV
ncbi:MAG: hypothetical protein KC458_05235 [Dehalococcoidia bacterium]|nr:hypothetical protein [Dehalococcoidia bacterium]